MPPILALGLFFAFLAMGMPIYLVLGFLATLLYVVDGKLLVGIPQLMADHLNSATLISIPFFVMAATFMQRGGIARALVDFAFAFVGRVRGGLAVVCVLATTVFAAISGSSVATALAMGTLLVPAMVEKHYRRDFALGVVGASGTLGILIPPSLAMIVYAIVAEESVPKLFLAGVVPGLLQAALFVGWIVYYCRRENYPREAGLSGREAVAVTLRALPALAVPVIVLGGIYGGLVTVAEAAALSAFVAILVSVLAYRGCGWSDVPGIIAEALKQAAVLIVIISSALVLGHWLTASGHTRAVVQWVQSMGLEPWQFLIVVNIILFILGMFLEVISVMLITLPLLLPIVEQLGIDKVHFAIIVTVNMEIALLTPPVGMNLYVLASISRAPFGEIVRGITPFVWLMLGLLVVVTYVPVLSLWLPRMVFG
ncbi:C4-dicarboxylate ABC transporter permease [Allostella sp. ATCC 35155]|nr:C4-dicarboxylate ABC transporter permease [Stella sp. ATCC 35155]